MTAKNDMNFKTKKWQQQSKMNLQHSRLHTQLFGKECWLCRIYCLTIYLHISVDGDCKHSLQNETVMFLLSTRGYDFWSNYLLLISLPKHVWSTEILSKIDDHPKNSLRRRTFGPFEFKYGPNVRLRSELFGWSSI